MQFLSTVCFITKDVEKLASFYCEVFQTKIDLNDTHVEVPVDSGGITIYSKSTAENDMGFDFSNYSGTGFTKISFIVDDVDAEYDRLKSLNIAIEIPPTTYPWGASSMHFRDLDGNIICFIGKEKLNLRCHAGRFCVT